MKYYVKIDGVRGLKSKGGPVLKDAFFAKLLFSVLHLLSEDSCFSCQEKQALLRGLIPKEQDKKSVIKALFCMKGLIELEEQKSLQKMLKTERQDSYEAQDFYKALEEVYQEAVKRLIPLKEWDTEKLGLLLQEMRDPAALFRYATCLKKSDEANLLLDTLASCIEEKIAGYFPSCRYKGPHLDSLFKSYPSLKDLWIKGDKRALEEFALSDSQIVSKFQTVDFKKLLKRSFTEEHVSQEVYPLLYNYLQTNDASIKQELIKNIQQKEDKSLLLQLKLIELIEASNPQKLIEEAIGYLPKKGEALYSVQFNADIEGLQKELSSLSSLSSFQLFAVETDDFTDLFLCGTEVEGSCQRIDGDPHLNKCLLGYVRDGKNRLIAIKDSNGVIKARAILRLLIDKTTGEPALFLERLYPRLIKQEWADAILSMAKSKAETLKLPLLSKEVGKGDRYPHALVSLGSLAPYEYVDASNGVVKEGRFEISGAHRVLRID